MLVLLVFLTIIQQEELIGWHASGVKRTRIWVIRVWISISEMLINQVKGNLVWVILVRAVEGLLLSFAIVARTEVDVTRPALSAFSSWFWITSDIHSIVYAVEPPLIDNLYLSTTATSLQQQLSYVPADSPYIGSCLYLSTTATATKECPQPPK